MYASARTPTPRLVATVLARDASALPRGGRGGRAAEACGGGRGGAAEADGDGEDLRVGRVLAAGGGADGGAAGGVRAGGGADVAVHLDADRTFDGRDGDHGRGRGEDADGVALGGRERAVVQVARLRFDEHGPGAGQVRRRADEGLDARVAGDRRDRGAAVEADRGDAHGERVRDGGVVTDRLDRDPGRARELTVDRGPRRTGDEGERAEGGDRDGTTGSAGRVDVRVG